MANWDGTLEEGTRVDEEGGTTSELIKEEERSVETLGAVLDLEVGNEGVIKEGRTSEMIDKEISKELGKKVDN